MSKLEELKLESGKVSEKSEGVSEQDLGNISELLKKGAAVRKQLQDLKKKENNIAKLLSILIKEIDNDKIIKYIFKIVNNNNNEEIFKIFSLFYPFLKIRFDDRVESKLKLSKKSFEDISSYINYIKNIDIKVNEYYLNLFKEIIFQYKVGILKDINFKSEQEKHEFENQLLETLKREFL